MRAAAATAIAQLRDGASTNEIQTTAQNAVALLVRDFENVRVRAEIVDGVCVELRGGTAREWEEGKEAVRAALADLPVEVSRRELERVRAKALASSHAAIAARQRAELLRQDDFRFYRWPDKLRRRAEAEIDEALNELPESASQSELECAREQVIERCQRIHERCERKARLIDSGVRKIWAYVHPLTLEFGFDESASTIAKDLEEPIREILAEELRGEETDDQVAALVRRSVREELDIR